MPRADNWIERPWPGSADPAGPSLDAILRRYYRELNALAYAKLRSRDAAADLVQEAVVRFLMAERARRPAEMVSPRHFLRTIVANLAVDALRRNRRRGVAVPLDDVAEQVVDPAPTIERIVGARQEYGIVKAALDAVPARCRDALLLNRVEGLSHAVIARRLGISPTMVAKDILRALRHCLLALTPPA